MREIINIENIPFSCHPAITPMELEEDRLDKEVVVNKIYKALEHCSPRDASIMLEKMEGATFEGLAKKHGVSKQRIQQIVAAVPIRVRACFSPEELKELCTR
jgi:hypothetical protein